MTPERPILRYFGGKWMLAPWIVSQFPPHRIYTEAFGGAASVLMRKPRSYAEVYNDLDGEVVNVFRVLRNPLTAAQLQRVLELTPFSREEFDEAHCSVETSAVELARRTIIKSFMGHGADSLTGPKSGFRSNTNKSNRVASLDWINYPNQIPAFVERLMGVTIENRDAISVLEANDTPETLHLPMCTLLGELNTHIVLKWTKLSTRNYARSLLD